MLVVREIVGVTVSVIGWKRPFELNSSDGFLPFQQSTSDPVHAVHHPSVMAEDDGIGQVDFLNEPHMVDHASHSRTVGLVVKPVDRVHLPYRGELHLSDWEISAEFDQPVDIPGVETVISGPEVILLPHRHSLVYPRAGGRW